MSVIPAESRGPKQPRPGDVLRVGRAASVQFGLEPILFRVIRIHEWSTSVGWLWLDGYQLNSWGDAVERRSIYVQLRGLQLVTLPFGRQRAVS